MCDCCPLAFHADCLEPLERASSLFVPIPKHGLKALEVEDREDLILKDAEWYCPYCLAGPIVRCWKRGVNQFLEMPILIDLERTDLLNDDPEFPINPTTTGENVIQWMSEITQFLKTGPTTGASYPAEILLALSGIRRAIQRHGNLYNTVSQLEHERYHREKKTSPSSMAEVAVEQAEPTLVPNVVTEKPHIMARTFGSKLLQSTSSLINHQDQENGQPVSPSDGESSTTTALPRRSTRRAQALEARRVFNRPQPPSEESEYDDQTIQPKVNVGPAFQTPGLNKHFLEAREFGLEYSNCDRNCFVAYLPCDHLGRTMPTSLTLASTCRLVYSATELRKRRDSDGGKNGVPVNDMERKY